MPASTVGTPSVQTTAASAARTAPAIQRIGVIAPPSEQTPSNGEELNTMEHIRQNLLTMHTLVSTVEAPELINVLHQHDLGYSNHHATVQSSNLEQIDSPQEDSNDNANAPRMRDRKFFVGQWIDVKDTVAQWLEATVMDINESEKTLFVHYNGWYVYIVTLFFLYTVVCDVTLLLL